MRTLLRTASAMTIIAALAVLAWFAVLGAALIVQDVARLIAEQIA